MKKVLIYGIDDVWRNRFNALKLQEYMGNLKVIGYSGGGSKYLAEIDGIKVYDQSEILKVEFDYLIVFNGANFLNIQKNFNNAGIKKEKIIDGKVFDIPLFDFALYTKMIENPITILSDDCWGGVISRYLGLPQNSPFVNLHLSKSDYLKFLKNPNYYLNSELKCAQEGDIYICQIPHGTLGDGECKITLGFNHHVSFKDAANDWNRRVSRVNWNNIFVKMSVDNANLNIIKTFEELPYDKKVCFAPKKLDDYKSTVYLPRYIQRCKLDAIHAGSNTFSAYVRMPGEIVKQINLLKMLNGEKDFRRNI